MKRTALAALALILVFSSLTGFAAPAPRQVIRVGYFAFSGYHERAGDGRMSGYGYEFLQRLASYGDWTYEYVGYESSYAEALEMLKRGEVDLVTSVSKTPDREEDFLFSDRSIGTNGTMFTVRAGNERVISGEYDTYDGLTIGMLEGNSKNDNFARLAREHGFSYKPVYFELEEDLMQALKDGELDGIVTGSLRAPSGEWVIETFDTNPFYAVTRRDDPELMHEIDEAIESMDLSEPDWRSQLQVKYYATDTGGHVMLNASERETLLALQKSSEPLTILINPDREPYTYFKDGEPRGIIPAMFELLAARLSLKYEYLPVTSRSEYYAMRADGQADVVLDFVSDYYRAEQDGYKITRPIVQASLARLTRRTFDGHIDTVAIAEPSDMFSEYVKSAYPDSEALCFSTVSECAQAVMDGRADAAIVYAYSAERLVQNQLGAPMTFTLLGDAGVSYAMGVRASEGHLLLSLLNRAVSTLSEDDVARIVLQETDSGTRNSAGLISFLYDNPIYAVVGVAFICLLAVMILMLIQRVRNQRVLNQHIDEISRRYEAQKKSLSDALLLADQANRAKTTFLNNMSHDIRTPMNAIIGFTTLASAHLDNRERTQDYLEKIAQSSNHLLSLINDVLDMSRIESGNVNIEEKPENLAEILHGLRNIIQSDIHSRQQELFIDTVDVTDEQICCDRLRLNQVLLNLLSNAIKFTDTGGSISLRVSQLPCARAGYATYEFRIRDTGIGMSSEFIKTIFEPFTRERTSTVSGIQGTGLGMAITKNIVDMMHGSIDVSSEVGKGTEFVVRFDFKLHGERTRLTAIPELKGLRALVVDDDLLSCQSVAKMLRETGMRAEWTLYGKEAVVRSTEAHEMGDPYRTYIVDWSMPDMNGVETVRRIRRAVGNDAPIILLSAYDWSEIEQEAREAGVTDFISKPIFASDLHRVLERTLGKVSEEAQEPVGVSAEFEGGRLLLVEDNELNREIATELLEEAGLTVEEAENGQIACDRIREVGATYYDLVLMDVQMPVMDGYEATQRIRAMEGEGFDRIPIYAMTANAFDEDRKKAREMGMDGHLAKPIDVDELMKLLRQVLQSKRIHDGAPQNGEMQ